MVKYKQLYQQKTTYQNDYIQFKLVEKSCTSCNDKNLIEPKEIKKKEFIYLDNETHIPWRKDANIPFDLLSNSNEITRSNPYKPFVIQKVSENNNAIDLEVLKTRPRIYMSPAVSMDDIPDPEMRRLLCKNLYTSEWTKASEETQIRSEEKDVPNTTIELSQDPIRLKTDFWEPIRREHKEKARVWENQQKHAPVDPTYNFWMNHEVNDKSGASFDAEEGLVTPETKEEIRDLIARDMLRLPHDTPIPGYTGYRPRLSYGVPLAKANLPVEHPLLSTTQALAKRYEAK